MDRVRPARVLGIVGSPRRGGNTDLLVGRLLEGAASQGAETDVIALGGLQIRECDGCHACWKGRECAKRDDMMPLYERIGQADVIVFGTPVYWYGPTALIKALLDRFVYFNCPEHRPKIRGKAAALVVPFEEEDPATGSLVVSLFERSLAYLEMRLAGALLVPGVGEKGDVLRKPQQMQDAFELGRRLARPGP